MDKRMQMGCEWMAAVVFMAGLAACAGPGDVGTPAGSTGGPAGDPLGMQVGAFDGAPRTIPYAGYVDFDGEPVNAGGVKFNFALFPCASPGSATCGPLWVAKGDWVNAADWKQGWPTGLSDFVTLPIFSGRFTVELGATGQRGLPAEVFEAGHETLYLGVQIEGRSLGALQKVVPSARTRVAERAYLAESALVADMVGELTPEEIATRRSWAKSGTVAPGATLEVQTFGDATNASVLLWEQRGTTWASIDPTKNFLDDPSLMAFYPFEEIDGEFANDASGRGKHLTLARNVTLNQPGVFGRALRFDGAGASAGGSATVTNLGLSVASGFTVSYWLAPTLIHSDVHYLTLDRNGQNHQMLHSFYGANCGPVRISFRSNNHYCSVGGVGVGAWRHVAVTYDPRNQATRVYQDGALDHSMFEAVLLNGETMDYLRFGARMSGAGYDYLGSVDDLAIFSRTLTAEEVGDLHRYGVANQNYQVVKAADGKVSVSNQSNTPKTLRMLVVK